MEMIYKHKNGIGLRKVERSDLPLLKDTKNSSWFGQHTIAFLNDYNQERWFESLDDRKNMVLVACDSGEPVGLYKISNIDWMNRYYDSAHDVFASARGKGYGKTVLEAGVDFGFEVLNMHRLDTEVLENNKASLKCALYCGFIEEGIKRKSIHKCGEYLDSIVLGILQDEWKELERVKHYGGVCNVSYQPKNNK